MLVKQIRTLIVCTTGVSLIVMHFHVASCRRSQSYLIFFLTNKEHEQEVIEGGKQRGRLELKQSVKIGIDEGKWASRVVS